MGPDWYATGHSASYHTQFSAIHHKCNPENIACQFCPHPVNWVHKTPFDIDNRQRRDIPRMGVTSAVLISTQIVVTSFSRGTSSKRWISRHGSPVSTPSLGCIEGVSVTGGHLIYGYALCSQQWHANNELFHVDYVRWPWHDRKTTPNARKRTQSIPYQLPS